MLLNVTQSRLVIGRFTILPGDKVPAFALTDAEAKAVEDFCNRGFLVEKEMPRLKPQAPVKKQRESEKSSGKSESRTAPAAETQEKPQQELEQPGEHKGE